MEKNLAILMADLSGYTALTETHGAATAADLIDRYLHIAEKCLVKETRIHERRGDEIMFVSESSGSLLATALKLQANIANEENFLQVHGALHYGKVLKRADSYFGSAINLVSRIAAKAAPGTFWCSDDFIDSIGDRSVCSFMPMGSHSFKNMAGKTKVYEIQVEKSHVHAIDPVCRMIIADRKNAFYSPDHAGHYFCSTQCLVMFRKNQIYPGTPDHQRGYKMSLILN